VESRLDLAKEIGATHTINTSSPGLNLVTEVKRITDGNGSTVTIDATGVVHLIKDGLEFTSNAGKMILMGVPPLDGMLNLHLISFLGTGKCLVGSMEGDAVPAEVLNFTCQDPS
jgi:Zn-dependent alcohol dehydrogenase